MKPPGRTLLAALVAALWLAGCAAIGKPRHIVLDPAELTRLVERATPFDTRLLELVDVRISRPRIQLLPERNRLATEMDLHLREPLTAREVSGRIAMDYALRYDKAAQAVRMTQVQVNSLHLDAVPVGWQPLLDRLGRLVTEQWLEGMALYRLTPGDLERTRGLRPGSVTVTTRGVEISMSPP